MRIKINYETTEVSFYRFVCNDPEIKSSYVGHTTNFTERKACHKQRCNNTDYKLYQIIRDNGGFDNWKMIEIESRLVKDKREAERIEQEWIEKFEVDMNKKRAFGKKDATEYFKEYYEKHREQKITYITQYAQENADKISDYQKEYQLKNADKLKEQKEQYYLDNKERWEKYTEKRKEKITCECGCVVSKARFTTHKKSPKHAKLMETKIASIV